MALEFEKWYLEKVSNKDARELFKESCLCYKVSAYRAAFLMTYLGFQNILKERLLKSQFPPQGIPQNLWERTLTDLIDDKKWDEAVFNNVNRTLPSNPFLIGDDIRKQYDYFRCIRNDCAHAKSNIISFSHIETLWLFIQSNYNKFVVNGGKDGLLERIKIHYNPVYTKPGSDINPIVEDIMTAMQVEEISLFLNDVYRILNESSWGNPFENNETGSDFWANVVFSANSDLRGALNDFVKSDWNIFLKFIDVYPDKLIEILSSSAEEFRREFWNVEIFKMFSWSYSNQWNILERILINNIIPNDEVAEFIKKLAKKVSSLPPDDKIEYLNSIGYINEIKRKIFGGKTNFNAPYGIDYGNNNWSKIKFLILNVQLDYEMVSQLNQALRSSSYGTFHDGLLKILEKNTDLRNRYKEILTQHLISIPESIQNL